MKLSGAKAEAYVRAPSASYRAVLLFGPDLGLVRERGKQIAGHLTAPDDPFALTVLSGDALKGDPAALSDGAKSLSLMGGSPVVLVRDCTDAIAGVVSDWLEAGAGVNPAVFEAGELSPRSKLRSLFEKRDDAAAIGCYADEGRDLQSLVQNELAAAGLSLGAGAMDTLVARLGTDRLAVRRELEKLVLYMGFPGGTITPEDVAACVGDVRATSLDEIAFAVAGGDLSGLGRAVTGAYDEGVSEIAIIRSVLRHLDRLHSVNADVAKGKSVEDAMKRLRPPVFYKFTGTFARQARGWSVPDLARGLDLLLKIEKDCKSGIGIERALLERTLFQLAQAARRFAA